MSDQIRDLLPYPERDIHLVGTAGRNRMGLADRVPVKIAFGLLNATDRSPHGRIAPAVIVPCKGIAQVMGQKR